MSSSAPIDALEAPPVDRWSHPLLREPLQRPFREPASGRAQRAVFIDRDGVINRLIIQGYVRKPEELDIIPEALEAIAQLANDTDYQLVLLTNQSVVGRGDISRSQLEAIHARLIAAVEAAGGRFDMLQICPHAPYMGCACRKPRPGMLFEAAELLNIDLTRSWTIGDSIRDMIAGKAAGTRVGFIRAQGWHDEREWDRLLSDKHPVDFVAATLLDAVDLLLRLDPEAG